MSPQNQGKNHYQVDQNECLYLFLNPPPRISACGPRVSLILHGQEVRTGWAEIRRLRDPVTLYVNGPDSSQL